MWADVDQSFKIHSPERVFTGNIIYCLSKQRYHVVNCDAFQCQMKRTIRYFVSTSRDTLGNYLVEASQIEVGLEPDGTKSQRDRGLEADHDWIYEDLEECLEALTAELANRRGKVEADYLPCPHRTSRR